MKKITLEELREELLKTGGYRSSPERLAKKRRAPGFFTTLGFTSSVFSVFPSCAWRELISGSMTQEQWAHYCFPPIPKAESYGVPVILDGWKERQSYKGPVIYLSNHMSTLETLLLPAITLTYGPLSTVVKESLSHLPCLRKAAIDMMLIPIGRKSPRRFGDDFFGRGESDSGKSFRSYLPSGDAFGSFFREEVFFHRREACGEDGGVCLPRSR